MEIKFRTLKADEIDVRVGATDKNSRKWITLLLYKDSRVDMNLLDETVGVTNWQRDHKELKGNLYCGVSIYDNEKQCWITKWDAGTESNTEKEKGEASDSFKRACVNWGLGRELYTAPKIFIYGNADDLKYDNYTVKEITYNENREIDKLVIVNKNGEIVYPKGKKAVSQKTTTKSSTSNMITEKQIQKIQILLKEKPEGYKEALYKKLGIKSSKELSYAKASNLIKQLDKKEK